MLIPFGTQSYQHEARQLSSQQMINCFLEKQAEGSKSPIASLRSPGIESFFDLLAPIRGGCYHDSKAFFVAGTNLYQFIGESVGYLGEIPGSGRVDMVSNGPQLGILDRSSVLSKNLYVYGDDIGLKTVSDPGFEGAARMFYSDLFGIFIKRDSDKFFISDAGASSFPDLLSYNALDFFQAEAAPGNLVTGIADHRELFLFKESSTEIWGNTGGDPVFRAIPNALMEIGCIAGDSVAKADNSVFWLANDLTVRRANGYTPARVSTHAIESAISKMATKSDAYALSHTYRGHIFYVLTFPSDNKTFVYDITTGLWAERSTAGKEWRPFVHVHANDIHYVGDSLTGKIGKLSGSVYTSFGEAQIVSITSPPIQSEGREIFFKRLQIDFDMGQGVRNGQGSDPQVMLQWSDNGGKTWSSEYWRSIGKTGEYGARAVWNRIGSSRDRVFRLQFSDPTPFTVIQAIADVSIGT